MSAQGGHQARVAGGSQKPRARTQNVEDFPVAGLPKVVNHQQARLVLERLPQESSSLVDASDCGDRPADVLDELGLQADEIRTLAEGRPIDAVGEGTADFAIVNQRDGQDRLADATHAMQADLVTRVFLPGASDAHRLVTRAKERRLQTIERPQTRHVMGPLRRNAVKLAEGTVGGGMESGEARFGRCIWDRLQLDTIWFFHLHGWSCLDDLVGEVNQGPVAFRLPQRVQR